MFLSTLLKDEWVQPGAVLAVLTPGPDVIQRALAQISGHVFTPIAFSFGWVAYAFTILTLAVSNHRFMPEPDFSCIVVNGKTGYAQENHSWIIGRILRDFDHWKPELVKYRLREVLDEANHHNSEKALKAGKPKPPPSSCIQAGLCVSIFSASSKRKAGVPFPDWVYYSGILVALVQLGIAAIPWALYREWAIFMITGTGIFLAFVTGSLPQWKAEKWGCPRSEKQIVLTRGIGAQHALLIIGDHDFLDLEVLARATSKVSPVTSICTILLAILWIAHLITIVGITSDPWFLMAVGGIGMLHNVMVAGLPRRPEAFGVHLEFEKCIAHPKVMETLMKVETEYAGVGASILGIFFPGRLRADDEQWWAAKAAAERAERGSRK